MLCSQVPPLQSTGIQTDVHIHSNYRGAPLLKSSNANFRLLKLSLIKTANNTTRKTAIVKLPKCLYNHNYSFSGSLSVT